MELKESPGQHPDELTSAASKVSTDEAAAGSTVVVLTLSGRGPSRSESDSCSSSHWMESLADIL